jgi:hypothetical protein
MKKRGEKFYYVSKIMSKKKPSDVEGCIDIRNLALNISVPGSFSSEIINIRTLSIVTNRSGIVIARRSVSHMVRMLFDNRDRFNDKLIDIL